MALYMPITTAEVTDVEEFLGFVSEQAQAIWGDNWRADLTRAYLKVVQSEGDEAATYENRRRHVYRIFERGDCTLIDALRLTKATQTQLQMLGNRE